MKIKIIYEDDDILVVDKPAGIVTIDLINLLSKQRPELKKVHRLDKNTSGVLLTAKNDQALIFLQKQFKDRKVEKKYLALVIGKVKDNQGEIKTLIGRSLKDRKKQKVYLPLEPDAKGKREAVTEYKVIQRFADYTLVEVIPKTGRKHQIRCHFSYLSHPVAGDKMYGFKNQACPEGLKRHFLHASYLKIQLPDGKIKEFKSALVNDLKLCLQKLNYLTKPN